MPKITFTLGKVQQAIGLGRFVNPMIVKSTLQMSEANGYTTKEIADYTKFMNHMNNDTTIDQLARLNDNIRELMGMEFPSSVPVLKLAAADTVKQTGEQYQTDHLCRLGINTQLTVLEGTHFFYHSSAAQVVDATDCFIGKQR